MTAAYDIRQAFLDFFRDRGHEVVQSAPLVSANDPTLMFINAGMVPFKDVFMGHEQRDARRAVSAQKCMRISGKHNDLEQVGLTARHHTLFEMLGNFSFGDYFKREAIEFAWELMTHVFRLPEERLVVTVFGGEGDIPADDEAARLWQQVSGLPAERIIHCGAADNFWQMGDTGPCGPCSEIHYFVGDGAPDLACFGQEPGDDGRGWVELWNLVFMQFARDAKGEMHSLPEPSIDTGAGLERLAAVLQGVRSNYDTDLLRPIVDLASELSGKAYPGSDSQDIDAVSMRVIADHARATAFLIAEGVLPDRDGRSYVLRRVMRRAVRYGHRLGIDTPFLHHCAAAVVDQMGDAYPELHERRALIVEMTLQEEKRFRQTLKRGLELLDNNHRWEESQGGNRALPGEVAFKLYDTYGFPLDVQQLIGREQGFSVDQEGFDQAMRLARERSSGSKVGDAAVAKVYHSLSTSLEAVRFVGYEQEESDSSLLALLHEGQEVDALREGQAGELITASTPFYAEAGGQVGDCGVIRSGDAEFVVQDTQQPVPGLVVHRGHMQKGALTKGATVTLRVDKALRAATTRNHSATHLLHWALRQVVGEHAMQKGSRVSPERLRFDYSATQALSADEVQRIEDLVNREIWQNHPIETTVLSMDEAKQRGAIGIFEEKYGSVVRMLSIGPSLELCGGVHAARTGDLGLFRVLSDSGLSAGVRRIEAVTASGTLAYLREVEALQQRLAARLKSSPAQLEERLGRLLEQQRQLQQQVDKLQAQLLQGESQDYASQAKTIGAVQVLGVCVPLEEKEALRDLADQLRDRLQPAVVLLGAQTRDGKALLVASVSKSLTPKLHAGKLVQQAAAMVGGKGGGRPDFAQAGGSDSAHLAHAVASAYDYVQATQ